MAKIRRGRADNMILIKRLDDFLSENILVFFRLGRSFFWGWVVSCSGSDIAVKLSSLSVFSNALDIVLERLLKMAY